MATDVASMLIPEARTQKAIFCRLVKRVIKGGHRMQENRHIKRITHLDADALEKLVAVYLIHGRELRKTGKAIALRRISRKIVAFLEIKSLQRTCVLW